MKNGCNPFDSRLADIKQELSVVEREQKNIESIVAWYKGFDIKGFLEKLSSDKASLNGEHQNATSLENAINDQRIIVKQDKKKAPFWFDPRKWFRAELREAARTSKESLSKLERFESDKEECKNVIKALQESISQLDLEIERYQAFDCAGNERKLSNIGKKFAELTAEYQRISHRKNKCDKLQAPVLEALRKSEKELNDVEKHLSRAEQYNRKLSNARNTYELAMIHQESERELGDQKPHNIIKKCQSKKASLERTIEKLENRLKTIADTLSIDIQTFVIDGNNLLYADDQFIGTAALMALTQKLLDEGYKVIIIFDDHFRSKKDIAKLKSRFQNCIEIRVAPRRAEADRAILNIADVNSTYVISNDTFRDFPEKKCVVEKRIFQHMITTGIIQIPDIDIQASFGES